LPKTEDSLLVYEEDGFPETEEDSLLVYEEDSLLENEEGSLPENEKDCFKENEEEEEILMKAIIIRQCGRATRVIQKE